MNHPSYRFVFFKNGSGFIKITKVNFVVFDLDTGDFFNSFQHSNGRPGVVVSRNDFKSVFDQVNQGMGANIARTTGNKYFFHCVLIEQVHHVFSVSTFEQRMGKFYELIGIDEAFSPGYFLNTGHFDSLSLFDYLDELRGLHQ